MDKNEIFYVGQKAFIDKNSEILIVHDPLEGLDFPGGRIEVGEMELVESLKREVREETGLEIEVGEPFTTWTNAFPSGHPLEGKKVFLVGYKCKYVSGEIKLSHEHDNFKWVNRENYKSVDDGTSYFDILEKYFNK